MREEIVNDSLSHNSLAGKIMSAKKRKKRERERSFKLKIIEHRNPHTDK